VCQPVQGADTVAERHGQGEQILDTCSEIIYSRIDQRDDKHFLFVADPAGADELGCQGAEGEGLAGAGTAEIPSFPPV